MISNEKSIEDVITLGPMAQATLVVQLMKAKTIQFKCDNESLSLKFS